MKEMIKAMVQEMVAQSIKEVMAEMMGTTPQVTPAEVVKPKGVNTLSREDFLAIAEEPEPIATPTELDFIVSGKTAKYNGYVSSDIWIANHLAISQNWNGRWSSKNKGYIFNSTADLRNFLMNYRIKTQLDDNDRHNIKVYKSERAKKQAEYYAKKAAE